MRHDRRGQSGMAMVEMVIVLPVLLMMLFAIAEFSIIFGHWQTLSNAAREGARTAVVFRTNCNAATVQAEVRQKVKDYAAPIGIALSDAEIVVNGVCGAANSNSSVSVASSYTFRVLQAFAGSLTPTIPLVSTSVMRNEGTG